LPRLRLHPLIAVAIAAFASLAVPAAAHADERVPRVGIVVTVQVNVSDLEATLLAERLGDALQDKLLVDVIAGRDVSRRLADFQMPEDCVAQRECISKVGKRLDADQLIFLVIVRVGKQFQIDPTWAEVTSGRTVAREAIALDESEALPERVFRPRALKLLPDAKVRKDSSSTLIIGAGEPKGRHLTTATWIAGGVGAAALLGGAIFGLQALSTNSDLEDQHCNQMPCADGSSRADRMETQMTYADVLFATAVVAGATAAVLYWTSAPKGRPAGEAAPQAEPPSTEVGLAPVPGGVYLQMAGHF
jgi:hypothetical protein